jgi:hypothetical protein
MTVRQEAEKYWSSEQKTATGLVMLQITYFYDSVKIDVDNIRPLAKITRTGSSARPTRVIFSCGMGRRARPINL